MITGCPECSTTEKQVKTRQIDASVYAGDYHGGHFYAHARQCVECGTVYEVQQIGKTVRLIYLGRKYLPPRKSWAEPLA